MDLHVSSFTKSVLHEIYNFTATVNHSNKMVYGITLSHYFYSSLSYYINYKQVIPVVITIYSNRVYKQSLVISGQIVVRGLTMAAAEKVGKPIHWKGAASPYITKYVTTRLTI